MANPEMGGTNERCRWEGRAASTGRPVAESGRMDQPLAGCGRRVVGMKRVRGGLPQVA